MNKQPAWKHLTDSSSAQHPGMLIVSTEYDEGGVSTGIRVDRADRWIEVAPDFLRRMRAEVEVMTLRAPDGFAVGRPGATEVQYRKVRVIDARRDLYARVDDETSDELLASNERPTQPGADDALIEITHQAIRSAARVDELNEELAKAGERNRLLTEVLNEVLGSFTQPGWPGEPCLRTGWVGTRIVARWRRIAAGRLGYDEMIEQLAGVELTDWQREHLRQVWEYRELHGRWPAQIHLSSAAGRRDGVAVEREALRHLIELAQQAEGSR